MAAETPYVREPGYAERYRDARFQSGSGPKTHDREVRAIRRVLGPGSPGRWLDVPSGAGRLTALLPRGTVQVDRDPEMLRACPGDRPRACASVLALPFADQEFAGVLCMRLMQHLPTSQERIRALTELRRVCRGPIVVSFFDSRSLQHLRRVIRRRLGKRRSGRSAVPATRFAQDAEAAGLQITAREPLRRYISEQWVVRLERT